MVRESQQLYNQSTQELFTQHDFVIADSRDPMVQIEVSP